MHGTTLHIVDPVSSVHSARTKFPICDFSSSADEVGEATSVPTSTLRSWNSCLNAASLRAKSRNNCTFSIGTDRSPLLKRRKFTLVKQPSMRTATCSTKTKIGQSVIGTTRKLPIVFINLKNSHFQTTHIHTQFISRYDRHASDPVTKDQRSVVQHERFAHEAEDRVSTKLYTEQKTVRAL